jgi:phage-related protein
MKLVKNSLFDHVYEVDCFEKEFRKTTNEKLRSTEPYERYQKWLIRSLARLEEMGREALNLQEFECLSVTSPKIYSIRYPNSKKNPRILYVYYEKNTIILLGAFQENNASDYERNIKIAQKRWKQLQDE